jgi:hypothetical protein
MFMVAALSSGEALVRAPWKSDHPQMTATPAAQRFSREKNISRQDAKDAKARLRRAGKEVRSD